MDFHALLAKMQELDRPATEGCGSPMSSVPPVPPPASEPPPPPPSMSVNLNAQGLENIEDMMRLFQKVNPDMMPKADPMPTMAPPPSIMSIKPELPPLKMLPDFDADNDDMPGGEKDFKMDKPKDIMVKMDLDKDDEGDEPAGLGMSLDRDGDGDHDMDDHRMEPKDKKQESSDEEWEEGSLDQFVNTNDYNFELEYTDDWDDAEEEFIAKVKREGHKITDINRDASPVIVAMAGNDFVAWYDLENTHGFIKSVDEAWDNEPNPEEKDIDYMVNKLAGGMNKSHGTYPKVAGGDNPMQRITRMEGEDLKAQIRDELRKRLAEAKGAK